MTSADNLDCLIVRTHTAVKIAPQYQGTTVHVLDASKSVVVVSYFNVSVSHADIVAFLSLYNVHNTSLICAVFAVIWASIHLKTSLCPFNQLTVCVCCILVTHLNQRPLCLQLIFVIVFKCLPRAYHTRLLHRNEIWWIKPVTVHRRLWS